MKQAALFGLTVTLLSAVLGCASDEGARMADRRMHSKRRTAAGEDSFDSSSGARAMKLDNEVGVYDGADVENAIAERFDEVRDCYQRAGRAQRYAGGKLLLRFMVGGDGVPRDVLVIASDLGNYEVERCVVGVGRAVRFPPPEGRKATTFEYPVEFKSTHEMTVQDVDDSAKIDRDVAALMHSLATCGEVAPSGAAAILYIEPSGQIGSVGLAAETTLDETAAACMVHEMRRWRMSAALPGRMLRFKLPIPPVIAAAEPASSHATIASTRRRRR